MGMSMHHVANRDAQKITWRAMFNKYSDAMLAVQFEITFRTEAAISTVSQHGRLGCLLSVGSRDGDIAGAHYMLRYLHLAHAGQNGANHNLSKKSRI
jgi:hypothetical protein